MADPISITAMALSAAGGVVSAFGAANKADASTAAYNYKAGVAKANEQVARQNRDYAIQVGGVKAEQEGIKGRQLMGQTLVTQASSGFDVNTGTAAAVRASQQKALTQSQATIANDASRKGYGYEVEGMNFGAEGRFDTMAGEAAQDQKGWDVASSLLGGATQVADKWSKFKYAGVQSV